MTNPIDPSEPPRIRDYFWRPMIDTAPLAPPACGEHPDEKPRRVMRTKWICPACVREDARGG